MQNRLIQFALIMLMFFFSCQRTPNIIATVGKKNISAREFSAAYEDFLFKTGLKDNLKLRESYLNSLIDREVLLIYADISGYRQRPDVEETLGKLADQVCINYYFKNYIYPDLQISDAELRQAYMRSLVELRCRHLYASSYEEALKLKERLEKGETFEDLAPEVFRDPWLSSHGGDLGWSSYGDLEPVFEDSAYSLNQGDISWPVKTRHGYSIIQVTGRRYNPFLREDDFQRKRTWLLLELRQRKFKNFMQTKTDEILSQLNIEINERVLPDLFPVILTFMNNRASVTPEELRLAVNNSWILKSKGETWDYEKILHRLGEVQKRQWERVRDAQDLGDLLKGLAIRNEIESRIDKLGIRNLKEVQEEILQAGNYKLVNMLVDSATNISDIPDSILLQIYRENPSDYVSPEMAEIAEIGVNSENEALNLIQEISNGSDFSSLAKKYSKIERSRDQGGYLGWGELSQFGKFARPIRDSSSGEIIGPFELGGMYLILKVISRKEPRQLDFQEAREMIRKNLWHRYQKKAYFDFLKRIKQNLEITVNHNLLQQLTVQESTGKS